MSWIMRRRASFWDNIKLSSLIIYTCISMYVDNGKMSVIQSYNNIHTDYPTPCIIIGYAGWYLFIKWIYLFYITVFVVLLNYNWCRHYLWHVLLSGLRRSSIINYIIWDWNELMKCYFSRLVTLYSAKKKKSTTL